MYWCLLQNSKRILRSYEISVPPAGVFDTGLDLSFSLQVLLQFFKTSTTANSVMTVGVAACVVVAAAVTVLVVLLLLNNCFC